MNQFKPQVITGIAGSHCVVLLYGWDVHIDAQIESPGYTRLKVMVGGVPRHVVNKLPDEEAPEQIMQLIRGYARDARF